MILPFTCDAGFRVVGIDASREMIAACTERFRAEIRGGRLVLLHLAIAAEDGLASFFISEGNRGVWSSLDPALASRGNLTARRVAVPARAFRGLLKEYGVPFYLKIAIEGADACA